MTNSSQFGLDQITLDKICSIFKKYSAIEKVILYGSRAKGNFRPGSDIDLTIVSPKMSTTELLKIEGQLDDLLLPYKIDLSLHHQIENKDLVDHIQRVGLNFYSGKI